MTEETVLEVVSTRIVNAPRELVWRAYTEAEHLRQWWGPKGFTNTFQEYDFRPGGIWRIVMHGPDGTDYPSDYVFAEIDRPGRLVIDHVDRPVFRATITFDDLGDQTRITFRQVFESADDFTWVKPVATKGNEENFDKLEAVLAEMR